MKNTNYLFLILFVTSAHARVLFTPLELRRGPFNKPLKDIADPEWCYNFWASGYQRSADEAYDCEGYKTPLSTLFFGKSDFKAQEVFPGSRSKLNPLLGLSCLSPRVKYKEDGAYLGVDLQRYYNDCVRYGLRVTLPARRMKITRCRNGKDGASELGGMTVRDFAAERTETVNGVTVKSYAYRLDFLSLLPYTCEQNCPGSTVCIVNYHDSDFANNPITISNEDITNQQGTPVSALSSKNGSVPPQPWAIVQNEAQNLPVVNADGSTIPNNSRGRFDVGTDYTPLGNSEAHQATLFIVPSVAGDNTTEAARVIQQQVNELLACINQEAEDAFKECCISFDSQCFSGAGDLTTELYAGYFYSPCVYLEGFIGMRWPTGKRSRNPLLVFRQPLGNNGHYEFKLGGQMLWEAHEWVSIHGDITGFILSKNKECVSSAFEGATIKNIGVPVTADITWNYLLLHTDVYFTPPNRHNFGGVLGYEFYYKSRDDIQFCQSTAIDCLGMEAPLDACVLEKDTRAIGHKIRGEAYIDACEWLQIYGGGTTLVGGRNVPDTTAWHLGFSVYY